MALDLAAVDRIMAAVDAPTKVNRQQLRKDLEVVLDTYDVSKMMRLAPGLRRRKKAKIVRTMKLLEWMLFDSDDKTKWWIDFPRRMDLQEKELIELRRIINKLICGLTHEETHDFDRTPTLAMVVSVELREVYEKHFGVRASVTKNVITDQFEGDFLDFAQATLCELGINNNGRSYSRGAIANAFWTNLVSAEYVEVTTKTKRV